MKGSKKGRKEEKKMNGMEMYPRKLHAPTTPEASVSMATNVVYVTSEKCQSIIYPAVNKSWRFNLRNI